MSLWSNLKSKFKATTDQVLSDSWFAFGNTFMGANSTGTRTDTTSMPIDSRRELTFRTRIELVKKSRWLRNNLGLYRRIITGSSRYAVGGGIVHIPDTLDTDWNKLADEYFDNWASNPVVCDVAGKLPFWRLQRYAVDSMLCDGEAFVLKVGSGKNADGTPVLPQTQWIESTRIGNLFRDYSMYGIDSEGFREGIRVNPFGKVVAYRYLQDSYPGYFDLAGQPVILPADAVRHIYNYERATALRGLPWAYHGMNSALDIMDITSLEKVAVKQHSALAGAIKKTSPDAATGFTGDLQKETITQADGTQKVIAFDNYAGGAGILQLGMDEELKLFSSDRPNVTWGGFIDFLVRDFAWGFGVSPELIWNMLKTGGPDLRFLMEDGNKFFEDIQDLIVTMLCRPIYTWVISRAILRGELPECKDPRWFTCHWQGPAKVTVDEGRLGQLEIARLQSGCLTWEEFWGSRGKSGKKMVHARIDEIKDAMDYAAKQNVPFEYFMALKPGTPATGGGTGSGSGDTAAAV